MTIALIDFSDLEHNTMPEPDRTKDNSTYWTPDFSVQHYKDMLFTPGGGSYGNPSLTVVSREPERPELRQRHHGTSDGWQSVTGTLPAGTMAYRLRYWTDDAAGGEGIAIGDVKFGSTEDTMSEASVFDLGGWRKVTGGQFTDTFHHW